MASGESNRQIASALGISEHTVARHLSNIFDKLGTKSVAELVSLAERLGILPHEPATDTRHGGSFPDLGKPHQARRNQG